MYALAHFFASFVAFLRLGITTIKTNPDPVQGIEQDGALVPNGAIVAALNALQTNGAPAFGNSGVTLIPASQAAATYSASQILGGIIKRFSGNATTTQDSTDTATNIVNAIPGAKPNQTFQFQVGNMSSNALTVAAGTGVTITGTNVIGGFSARLFAGQVTGSAAVTITSVWTMPLSSGL